jgi:hypothetical protein
VDHEEPATFTRHPIEIKNQSTIVAFSTYILRTGNYQHRGTRASFSSSDKSAPFFFLSSSPPDRLLRIFYTSGGSIHFSGPITFSSRQQPQRQTEKVAPEAQVPALHEREKHIEKASSRFSLTEKLTQTLLRRRTQNQHIQLSTSTLTSCLQIPTCKGPRTVWTTHADAFSWTVLMNMIDFPCPLMS